MIKLILHHRPARPHAGGAGTAVCAPVVAVAPVVLFLTLAPVVHVLASPSTSTGGDRCKFSPQPHRWVHQHRSVASLPSTAPPFVELMRKNWQDDQHIGTSRSREPAAAGAVRLSRARPRDMHTSHLWQPGEAQCSIHTLSTRRQSKAGLQTTGFASNRRVCRFWQLFSPVMVSPP